MEFTFPPMPDYADWPVDRPLFTGDDYQLVVEAAEREAERLRTLYDAYGVMVDPDDQIPRMHDLLARLKVYLERNPPPAARPEAG